MVKRQRVIINVLKNSEFDLASWPEEVLSNLADVIVAALSTAEFISSVEDAGNCISKAKHLR